VQQTTQDLGDYGFAAAVEETQRTGPSKLRRHETGKRRVGCRAAGGSAQGEAAPGLAGAVVAGVVAVAVAPAAVAVAVQFVPDGARVAPAGRLVGTEVAQGPKTAVADWERTGRRASQAGSVRLTRRPSSDSTGWTCVRACACACTEGEAG
jgi:hypothetical protein